MGIGRRDEGLIEWPVRWTATIMAEPGSIFDADGGCLRVFFEPTASFIGASNGPPRVEGIAVHSPSYCWSLTNQRFLCCFAHNVSQIQLIARRSLPVNEINFLARGPFDRGAIGYY